MVAGRIHRLLKLIALLQSGRVYNSTHLARECEVSRRTVFRDLKTLQESGIYVLYDEEKQGYALPWKSIVPFKDLTFEEALALFALCQDLDQTTVGLPFDQFARSASTKVLNSLSESLRENVIDAAQAISVWCTPVNPDALDASQHKHLFQAAISQQNVRIQYRCPGDQKTHSTMLSPYHILYANRQWYAVGRSSVHRAIKAFPILKIVKTEILDETFKRPSRFKLERYLRNSWDPIRRPGKATAVKIRFQSSVAQRVSQIAWDPSQEIRTLKGGRIEFRARVDNLDQIVNWVLSFGDQAEVITPRTFRNLIRQKATDIAQIYSN